MGQSERDGGIGMMWQRVKRCDERGRRLADRHYSRQTPGARGYTPPAQTLVFLTLDSCAVWASSWPRQEYVHRTLYPGAWVNSLFRNESGYLSSELICQAIAATRAIWGDPPADGMVTMIDPAAVRSPNPGWCYKVIGFVFVGRTRERGYDVLRLAPEDMPEPCLPDRVQLPLWEAASANG